MFRIATIQYKATTLPEDNRRKIISLCETAVEEDAKVVVFPEMSLTGYLWPDKESLRRFAEPARGESYSVFSEFCRENDCYLSYGFAEKDGDGLFNSQNLIGSDGDLLGTYRKVHLYEADKFWALPGNRGFSSVDTPLGKMGLGICMDLNFSDFVEFHASEKTDWLLFATNWLESDSAADIHPYWRERLKGFDGTTFMANTFGLEYPVRFCGQSCIVQKADILDSAPCEGETILITRHRAA